MSMAILAPAVQLQVHESWPVKMVLISDTDVALLFVPRIKNMSSAHISTSLYGLLFSILPKILSANKETMECLGMLIAFF